MHIGIDASRTTRPFLTGTENYALNLIQSLGEIDAENRYSLYFNGLPKKPLVNATNFTQKNIPASHLWTQYRLAVECMLHAPDILFVPAHTLPLLRRPRLKTVVTVHDLGAEYLPQYHQFPQKLYLNRSTEYVAHHATHLIAVSESTKKDLIKKLGVSAEMITVVYEGVDHERFRIIDDLKKTQILKRKYALDKNYILFVGTIQPRKNLILLITAFSKVLKTCNPNLDLLLVGKRGWLADDIYACPRNLGIENEVRFLDYVDAVDLPLLYNAANLFVLPSLYEGFGLPLLEAMACGCPALASDSSSLPEILANKNLLFETASASSLSNKIIEMLKSENLRRNSIREGLRRAQDFTWKKCAENTLRIFEKVYRES